MRKLRLRLAKQFAQNHTSSSWQYPNFNQDGIAPKSIVLREEAVGETSLPRCLLICGTPASYPSRNVSLLCHTASPVLYVPTLLLSEHTSQFPCGWWTMCCVSLPGWSISLSVGSPLELLFSVTATNTFPKRLLHQPASYVKMMWTGLQPTHDG